MFFALLWISPLPEPMLLVGVFVLFLLSWFSTDVVCFFSFILYTLWCKKGHFLEGPYAWISFFV